MKILVAVNKNLHRMSAVSEAARFAANAWPDVTLLAVGSGAVSSDDDASLEERHPLVRALRNCHKIFLAVFGSARHPRSSGSSPSARSPAW